MHSLGNNTVAQVLIKWSGRDPDFASWQGPYAIRQQFPQALAQVHVGAQGGGVIAHILSN